MRPLFFSMIKQAALAPSSKHQEKLDSHFVTEDNTKWRSFRRNLRAKSFAEAVSQDERADSKLKTFAKMINLHQTGKGPTIKIPASSGGKPYAVKYHPAEKRYTCSCGDWTYVKSVKSPGQSDCKHIAQVKSQSDMVTKSANAFLLKQVGGFARLGATAIRKENAEENAWKSRQAVRAYQPLQQRMKMAGIRGLAAGAILKRVT